MTTHATQATNHLPPQGGSSSAPPASSAPLASTPDASPLLKLEGAAFRKQHWATTPTGGQFMAPDSMLLAFSAADPKTWEQLGNAAGQALTNARRELESVHRAFVESEPYHKWQRLQADLEQAKGQAGEAARRVAVALAEARAALADGGDPSPAEAAARRAKDDELVYANRAAALLDLVNVAESQARVALTHAIHGASKQILDAHRERADAAGRRIALAVAQDLADKWVSNTVLENLMVERRLLELP